MRKLTINCDTIEELRAIVKHVEKQFPRLTLKYTDRPAGRPSPQLDQLREIVTDLLKDQPPLNSKKLNRALMREGFSQPIFKRARKKLPIEYIHTSATGWMVSYKEQSK